MLFGTAVDITTAINEYAVRSRRQIKFTKSDKRGVTAKCVGNEYCAWKVSVTFNARTNSWQVKSINKTHLCTTTRKLKKCNYKWLARNLPGHY